MAVVGDDDDDYSDDPRDAEHACTHTTPITKTRLVGAF